MIGEDKNKTIIDGQKKRSIVVKFKADVITFSGFSVIHSKNWANDAGMHIYSSNNIVKDNIITDNFGGEGGIVVDGDYNEIINNIIKNNKRDYSSGILIGHKGHYNVVSGNIIDNNYMGMWIAADHGTVVVDNHISNSSHEGIMIRGVEDCGIHDNIIVNNNGAAISIEWDSSKVIVYNNMIKDNGKGLVIKDAVSVTVTSNSFYVNGIQLTGNKLDYWISHNIYFNTINGKPIYFFKSEKDLVVPPDAGQLILADCSNCIVENLHISNVDYGIQLGYSNDNDILSNEFYDNVGNCISILSSSNNVIEYNSIENNLGTGIEISGISQNNEITRSYIINNDIGIYIRDECSLNIVQNNFIENNNLYGVYLKGSENNINSNNFKNNKVGIYIAYSYDNSIIKNNFIKNSLYNAFFKVDYTKQHENKWKSNYYGLTLGFLPKLIWGSVKTRYYMEFEHGRVYFNRWGLNFDWRPARKPFDI